MTVNDILAFISIHYIIINVLIVTCHLIAVNMYTDASHCVYRPILLITLFVFIEAIFVALKSEVPVLTT